jgi:hypothetical protein
MHRLVERATVVGALGCGVSATHRCGRGSLKAGLWLKKRYYCHALDHNMNLDGADMMRPSREQSRISCRRAVTFEAQCDPRDGRQFQIEQGDSV